MHFKYPEILWALFFLLIPVIVHLFQLRKFQKTPFTNVRFLRAIQQKTRKSSQVKKWLVLMSRVLLLTCLVLAFAQPYLPNSEDSGKPLETVIYLDNSFSMQANGPRGELLRQAVQDVLTEENKSGTISLFTNDATYADVSISSIKQELLQLDYAPDSPAPQSVLLQGRNLFGKDSTTLKNFILISDFGDWPENSIPQNDSLIHYNLVRLSPQNTRNTSIDSIYISGNTAGNLVLSVNLSKNDSTDLTLPVSLYNNNTLIAKTTAGFHNSGKAKTEFRISGNETLNGKVVIEDNGLLYDNTMYFNINREEKAGVLAINQTDAGFLERIFTDDEFRFISTDLHQLDYSLISGQDLVILNGLNTIPAPLITTLEAFHHDGKHILIIPSVDPDEKSHNQLFNILETGSIKKIYTDGFSYKNDVSTEKSATPTSKEDITAKDRKKITDIRISHPLFENVFDQEKKQLTNFQYPEAKMIFDLRTEANTILAFEDGNPFMAEKDRVYFFTGPLDTSDSNFQNSPLIVPVLYNIGRLSLQTPELYYQTGRGHTIDIRKQTGLSRDAVVSLEKDGKSFIPMQRAFPGKIQITTGEVPARDGIYHVKTSDSLLQNISFNYSRKESKLHYPSFNASDNVSVDNSFRNTLEEIKNTGSIRELWKWFVIFAIVFLVTEILLLKFFK
ncbi:BatA domain-containing protein [Sinomicrobium sp. M5D2P17]